MPESSHLLKKIRAILTLTSLRGASVHAEQLCLPCVQEGLTGKLAAPGDHGILQDITVGYMQGAGLLDMTLQVRAVQLHSSFLHAQPF